MRNMAKQKANLEVDQQILDLAEKVAEFKKSLSGKAIGRYPLEIQKSAVALYKRSGLSKKRFGEVTGTNDVSLAYWIRQLDEKQFKSIKIKDSVPVKAVNHNGYTIELASGAKITGLQMDDIQKLIGMK
jgi:hypothetical protein